MKILSAIVVLGLAVAPVASLAQTPPPPAPAQPPILLKKKPPQKAMPPRKAVQPAPVQHRYQPSYRERRDIQRFLLILGFDPRGIDGVFGPGTRAAIRAWQHAHGYSATGALSAAQAAKLRAQAKRH